MRELIFDVKQQRLTKNKDCDFGHIVAGTKGYLVAKFNLDENWDDCVVAVSYFDTEGNESGDILDKNCISYIPASVLKGEWFEIRLVAFNNSNNYMITSNKVKVEQEVF